MALFGKLKKKGQAKEASGRVLPSFVLLDTVEFDVALLAEKLQEDWGIEIPPEQITQSKEKEDDLPALVVNIENRMIAVSLMPTPIPNGEAVENAKTNFRWDKAVEVAEGHKAHLLVFVMGETNLKAAAALHTKFCASCLKLSNATGINTAGTVLEPGFYIDSAKLYLEHEKFPILNHIFFGIYSNDNGASYCAYTYGLGNLGKQDLEVLNANYPPDELFRFMTDIVSYIMDHDAVLKHGETLGFSQEQKLAITESAGIAIPEKTLKIAF